MKTRRVEINLIALQIGNGKEVTCSPAQIADVGIIRNIDKLQAVRFNQQIFVDLTGCACAYAIGTTASNDEILVSVVVKVGKCVAVSISALLDWKCVRLSYELETLVEVKCRRRVMVSYKQVIHPIIVYVCNHNGKGVGVFGESHFPGFVFESYAWRSGVFRASNCAQAR